MFLNDRTGQVMVHPDIDSSLLQDLYVSPLEYDPGQPAGALPPLVLTKGESVEVAGVELAFLGFDLGMDGGAVAQMEAGNPITIGARLAVRRGDREDLVTPIYRFRATGEVHAPPIALPEGGQIQVAGLDATSGAVRLLARGLDSSTPGVPARISVDVTEKPLIQLVWGGLYVILFGGLLALGQRLREARVMEGLAGEAGEASLPEVVRDEPGGEGPVVEAT
jgi:cytochrome c-type biogenesis protein CcmF